METFELVPTPKRAAGVEIFAREDAVAEIGFGDRAESGDGARGGEITRLQRVHVRRVDEAPAAVDAGAVEEPAHRPLAERRDAVLDLADLLGGVDMDRPVACERDDVEKFGRRRRPQAVRRDADRLAPASLSESLAGFQQAGEGAYVGDEPSLLRPRRRPAEATVGVEDRQQRQADAGLARRGDDASGHFSRVGVGAAVRRVMEIVEFGDGGEARFQHLDIELSRHGLDVVRIHLEREAVHGLPPGPECVGAQPSGLGEARHRPLKGVAVQVREGRNEDGMTLIARARGDAGFDRRDPSRLDREADAESPAAGDERAFGINGLNGGQGVSPIRLGFLAFRSDMYCN